MEGFSILNLNYSRQFPDFGILWYVSFKLAVSQTRTIIVHRSEDVIFSARTKNVAAVSLYYLYIYQSINLCINIYLSVYLSVNHKNELIFRVPMQSCMPSQQVATLDTTPPWPHAHYIFIYLSIYALICIFFFIHLSIHLNMYLKTIYLPY